MSTISQCTPSRLGFKVSIGQRLRQIFFADAARLAPEEMPDHMKRDLGLLRGRAYPPRDLYRD